MAEEDLKLAANVEVVWGSRKLLELTLNSPAVQNVRRYGLFMDVYGQGLPGFSRLFLPLKQGKYLNVELKGKEQAVALGIGPSPKDSYKQRVLDELKKLERADKAFVVEVLSQGDGLNPDSVCAVAVRPSTLRAHLECNETGPYLANVPDSELSAAKRARPGKKTLTGALLRWALCPMLTCVGGWLLLLKRDAVLAKIPILPGFGWVALGSRLQQVLPPVPKTLVEAYDLGVLCEQLRTAGAAAAKTDVLAAAAELLGRHVTAEELESVRAELVRMLSHRSVGQRVLGLFTFVNTMWLGAIGGITISVGPVLWHLLKPLRRLFVQLAEKVKTALVWLFEKIVLPTVVRFHEMGIWEALAHGLAFLLTAQGCRMQEGPAEFVAISGLVASLCASGYSTSLHAKAVFSVLRRDYRFNADLLVYIFMTGLFAPAAIQHQSKLLGFATTGSLLAALGFSAFIQPFCYCIGWESHDAMVRTCAASGLGVGAFCILRYCNVDSKFLAPFAPGVSVLGGLTHYLALLIRSNMWYRHGRDRQWVVYNLSMLGSLGISQAFGRIHGMGGLANTSTTFMVLWALEKAAEINHQLNLSGWFLIFGGSIAAYYSALWLHANPAFVVSLFQSLQ